MLGNALILTVSRTTTVRFFKTAGRTRLLEHEFAKKARKKIRYLQKIIFVFPHLTPIPNFLSNSRQRLRSVARLMQVFSSN